MMCSKRRWKIRITKCWESNKEFLFRLIIFRLPGDFLKVAGQFAAVQT